MLFGRLAEKTGNEGVSLCLIVSVGMEGQARKVSRMGRCIQHKGLMNRSSRQLETTSGWIKSCSLMWTEDV